MAYTNYIGTNTIRIRSTIICVGATFFRIGTYFFCVGTNTNSIGACFFHISTNTGSAGPNAKNIGPKTYRQACPGKKKEVFSL